MQIKYESHSIIIGSKLVSVDKNDIKDGVFNCPDEVEVIMESAFLFNKKLITTVNLNKVKQIEKEAFMACPNLTTVKGPQVEIIGREAFIFCPKLITVDLSKVKIIEKNTFYNCIQLTTLILHPSVRLDFKDLKLQCKNLHQIIINNLENSNFDKDKFVSQLPSDLEKIKIIFSSELPENLCHGKILNQNVITLGVEITNFSFYSQPSFFSTVIQEPCTCSDVSSAASYFAS